MLTFLPESTDILRESTPAFTFNSEPEPNNISSNCTKFPGEA